MIETLERIAQVIAVTSGKGGVGKTNISVNLSVALARLGKQAMLVDGDLGLANANILLGLNGGGTIADILSRDSAMPEVVQAGPAGIFFVPGHSGSGVDPTLSRGARERLADAFRPYAAALDHVLVDTSTGISEPSLDLVAASDRVLLVLSEEPTAFMDAYALVKALTLDHGCGTISVVTNMVADDRAGHALFRRFDEVIRRFLPTELVHLGSIPRDDHVREAIFRKRCVVEAFPGCRASIAFNRIADAIAQQAMPLGRGGHRFFGMEALRGAH